MSNKPELDVSEEELAGLRRVLSDESDASVEEEDAAIERVHEILREASGGEGPKLVAEFEIETPDVAALRKRYDLSQEEFAERLDISVATLRNWEQGRRMPTGPARVLLSLIEENAMIAEYLLKTSWRTANFVQDVQFSEVESVEKDLQVEPDEELIIPEFLRRQAN